MITTTVDVARELYDRFVMGGWEPHEAYPILDAMAGELLVDFHSVPQKETGAWWRGECPAHCRACQVLNEFKRRGRESGERKER